MRNYKLLKLPIQISILTVFLGAIINCGFLTYWAIFYYEQLLRWNIVIGLSIGLLGCLYSIFLLIGLKVLATLVLKHEGLIK